MNSQFTKIVRIFLGIVLLFSGANKFFEIVPNPEAEFLDSFGEVSYLLTFVGALEIAIAVLLLAKKWVAFSLILLAPISINILLFHLYVHPSTIAPAVVIALFNAILIYKHWPQYRPLFM